MSSSKVWLNGNALARKIIAGVKQTIQLEVANNPSFYQLHPQWASPQLHILNIGFDDASLSYIRKKIDLASSIGIKFRLHQFIESNLNSQRLHDAYEKIVQSSDKDNFLLYPFGVTADLKTRVQHISRLIDDLNEKAEVSGILLQLPMQAGLKQSADELIDRIDPLKDVDCLNISNRSRIIDHARPELIPCTPAGVLRILDQYNVKLEGRRVVIVGRSALVGLPLFHLLLNRNATTTLCHAHTLNLNALTQEADVVISAVGKADLITQLKPGAISIDIGISRNQKGKLCGDILESAKRESWLSTPVPGGVGPLTVAMLMQNTVKLWRKQMSYQQQNA